MANLELDNDTMYLRISTILDALCSRVDDTVTEQEKQLETNKKNTELETRFAQELKLNEEVSARVSAAERRGAELVRAVGRGGAAVAPSDQQRLHTAREMYQIAKELTGIRWDFSAPADLAKGYIKSESRKLLEAFSVSAGAAPAELWERVGALGAPALPASAPGAPALPAAAAGAGKENLPPPSRHTRGPID